MPSYSIGAYLRSANLAEGRSYKRMIENLVRQDATMLATSKNVLFPGHNHLLTTSTDDLTLYCLSSSDQRVIIMGG